MAGDDPSFCYASCDDSEIDADIKHEATRTQGYFIYPSQLFCNVVAKASSNENLNTDLKNIFQSIESSALGYDSEKNIKGLFSDFDITNQRLGTTVKDKNARLLAVLRGVASLDLGDFRDHQIDLFGDAYEFLISNYAANAGKSGGEFFTPQSVSKLLAKLALLGQSEVNKVYDPTAGSGSLLLQVQKQFSGTIEEGFFGQEINYTTYNLARMNMFLHGVNYNKFHFALGNTLTDPQLQDDRPFDVVVSNPPYSRKWIGADDPTLIHDERFAPAGMLAPKSKADFAFVLHALHYLSTKGRAAIVCFPGIFYRSGAEAKIRQYLVDNNFVSAVIALPANLFFGTSIATNILVLSKNKKHRKVQFINASELFSAQTNNNVLEDTHIETIINAFASECDEAHFSRMVDVDEIRANNYNLAVNSYVEAKDTQEIIDIHALNQEIAQTVAHIDTLRCEIDRIVQHIEGAQ